MRRLRHLLPLIAIAASTLAVEPVPVDHAARMAKGTQLFNSHIGQLLTDHCVKCHGGEKGTKSDFDLSTRELLLKGGAEGASIIPGNARESFLMKLVRHEEEPPMPHKADKLPADSIAKLAEWIDLGAPYAKPLIEGKIARDRSAVTDEDRNFWAFQPLIEAPVPAASERAKAEASPDRSDNPIDRFIETKLAEHSAELFLAADRRTLLRRAYFNLIGLPPTPEQGQRFLEDPRADAYEKLIDELLASPHYGERWGRHWLDLARYAESHGYEQDYDRPNAFHFRDFVIHALNADMPYDQFVRWQIAGDELAPDEPEAWKATGFLAAGTHATQITANQAEKERYDELDDKMATIGSAMLGLTVGCARCHDHKFDPIPIDDYYRLISTFTTTVRSDYDLVVNAEQHRIARAQWQREQSQLIAAREKLEREQLAARLEEWEKAGVRPSLPHWLVLEEVQAKSKGGANFTRQSDGSHLVTGKNVEHDTYTFTVPAPIGGITAVRLDALADPSLVKGGPGRASNGNFALTEFTLTVAAPGVPAAPAKFSKAKATFEQRGLPVAAAIDADAQSGWAVDPEFGRTHTAVFTLQTPLHAPLGSALTFTLKFRNNTQHSIGRPRLSVTRSPSPALDGDIGPGSIAEALRVLDIPRRSRTSEEQAKLLAWFRGQDAEWRALDDAVAAHARKEPQPEKVKALICSENVPAVRLHTQGPDFYEKTYFLKRGDLAQKSGEAPQGFLQVLSRAPKERWITAPPPGARTPHRRTALAKWITDTEAGAGHLLARVIVNRLWQHHFGQGIVATPSDFGKQGARPAHPELLDWLARELIRNGWRLKPLHKLIMTSAAFQQATRIERSGASTNGETAGEELLFTRFQRRRLEGEVIRDSILSVTGVLDRKLFGPSQADPEMRRRSIYFEQKRSALPAMLTSFDGPDTLQSLGARAQTTVAPQALFLMNNELVRAAARDWAKRLDAKNPEEEVRAAYRAALSRTPDADELATAVAFLDRQRASYAAGRKPSPAALALTDFCQSVLGLNEFVYVE